MTVNGLATSLADIYRPVNTQDVYGAMLETFIPLYTDVLFRVMYEEGTQTIIDGKEENIPIYRLFIGSEAELKESDKIVDKVNNNVYDIINIYDLFYQHQQVDAKLIDMIDMTI